LLLMKRFLTSWMWPCILAALFSRAAGCFQCSVCSS
jgi:hypothetical protein